MEYKEIHTGMEFARNDEGKQEFGVMQYDNEKKFQKVVWGSKELGPTSFQHIYNGGQIGHWELENLDKLEEEYKIKSGIASYLKEELQILVTKPEQYIYSLILIKTYYYLLGDVDKAKEYYVAEDLVRDNKDINELYDVTLLTNIVNNAIARASLGDLMGALAYLLQGKIILKRKYSVSHEGFEKLEKYMKEKTNEK